MKNRKVERQKGDEEDRKTEREKEEIIGSDISIKSLKRKT